MPIDFGFNAREDLVPEVHFLWKTRFGRVSPPSVGGFVGLHARESPKRPILRRPHGFAPRADRMKSGAKNRVLMIPPDFPQFFPQVWKTLGRDQTPMELDGCRCREGRGL
jgi:hypothetical protein